MPLPGFVPYVVPCSFSTLFFSSSESDLETSNRFLVLSDQEEAQYEDPVQSAQTSEHTPGWSA